MLREISALDERLSVFSERYDGAREHLQTVELRLRAERVSLTRARAQYHRALDQVARLLVSLYTEGSSSSLDAIVGAHSVAEMLTIADAQAAIARQRSEIAATAKSTRRRVQIVVAALQTDQAQASATVDELARTRLALEHGLAQRQQLLASVRAQIARLQAQERARQQRLLAAARARLAAASERAARARAAAVRAAQRARARAEKASPEAARTAQPEPTRPPATQTTTSPSQPPAVPAQQTTTGTDEPNTSASAAGSPATSGPTSTDPTTTASAPASTAVDSPAGAGHPQAAQIALGFVGVPYLWGGATPAGFDCSGLVSYVFAQLGVSLPHYAAAQFGYGAAVARDQLQPGDLVFFDNLDHVGIYIGADEFVDAPHTGAFVRIESLADPWYANRYVGGRRI